MADILDKTWEALVADVEKAVDADVNVVHIDAMVKFFKKDVGFAKPSMCSVSESKILGHDKCPTNLLLLAGVSRIMHALDMAQKVRRAKAEAIATQAVRAQQLALVPAGSATAGGQTIPPNFPPQHPMLVSEMERDNAMYLMGGSGEALAVCRLLGGGKAVEMDKVLAKCNAKELPHHLQPDMEVLKIMMVDSAAAAKEGRLAFVYFELPRPQFLPTWLPASVIGQKIDTESYDHQPLAGDVSGLRKLGAALDKASYSKMFFRKLEHYLVAYETWSMAAIGCDQWSVTAMTAHRDLVLQIIEDERRTEGWKGLFIGLLSCELRRAGQPELGRWRRRCERWFNSRRKPL